MSPSNATNEDRRLFAARKELANSYGRLQQRVMIHTAQTLIGAFLCIVPFLAKLSPKVAFAMITAGTLLAAYGLNKLILTEGARLRFKDSIPQPTEPPHLPPRSALLPSKKGALDRYI